MTSKPDWYDPSRDIPPSEPKLMSWWVPGIMAAFAVVLGVVLW